MEYFDGHVNANAQCPSATASRIWGLNSKHENETVLDNSCVPHNVFFSLV